MNSENCDEALLLFPQQLQCFNVLVTTVNLFNVLTKGFINIPITLRKATQHIIHCTFIPRTTFSEFDECKIVHRRELTLKLVFLYINLDKNVVNTEIDVMDNTSFYM